MQGPQPPQGYIGTPEAAKIVGVHQETIRNWVRDEKLIGRKEYDPGSKQHRYWIKRESIDALMAEKEPERIEAADQLSRRTEDIFERIANQERSVVQQALDLHEQLHARLDRVEERQDKVLENLESAVGILKELGERSKAFQDKVIEMVEEEREYLRKQREELGQGLGHEERRGRGFWSRLFGIR